MQHLPEQKRARKQLEYVDTELLGQKQNVKVFKKAAYGFGVGIGFLLVLPLLPDMGDSTKSKAMLDLFHTLSLGMIFYAGAITLGYFFLRSQIKFIMFALNWIYLPSFGIWAATQGYGILTGGSGS